MKVLLSKMVYKVTIFLLLSVNSDPKYLIRNLHRHNSKNIPEGFQDFLHRFFTISSFPQIFAILSPIYLPTAHFLPRKTVYSRAFEDIFWGIIQQPLQEFLKDFLGRFFQLFLLPTQTNIFVNSSQEKLQNCSRDHFRKEFFQKLLNEFVISRRIPAET